MSGNMPLMLSLFAVIIVGIFAVIKTIQHNKSSEFRYLLHQAKEFVAETSSIKDSNRVKARYQLAKNTIRDAERFITNRKQKQELDNYLVYLDQLINQKDRFNS